jgi:demethylmenaquinone methyltransferase/2-methoxy-6-polyprenyl-1,4-benzoquinol methylase
MDTSVWHSVISSIEETAPLYDEVNEIISFGRASKARTYAARRLMENGPRLVLDSGAGPGTMSMILLQRDPDTNVVALDYSSLLLRSCKKRAKDHRDRLHFIRACFEELPFRPNSLDAAVTAYALRDSSNLKQAIDEYARSIRNEGRLAIVELGKPDNVVKGFFAAAYVRLIAPLIAKIIISDRLEGNPWLRITPTYQNLPTTRRLLEILKAKFDLLEKKTFLAGGILVIILQSRSSRETHI